MHCIKEMQHVIDSTFKVISYTCVVMYVIKMRWYSGFLSPSVPPKKPPMPPTVMQVKNIPFIINVITFLWKWPNTFKTTRTCALRGKVLYNYSPFTFCCRRCRQLSWTGQVTRCTRASWRWWSRWCSWRMTSTRCRPPSTPTLSK